MREARFLVTDECGRLARWLRLCGYDTVQAPAQPLGALYRTAYHEGRVIATRNRNVRASRLFGVVHLKSAQLEEQLQELMRALSLTIDPDRTFSRCDRCNIAVEPIEKPAVRDRVPPYVFHTQHAFHRCPSCQRIYWAATHWQRACRLFDRLREEASHA